MGALTKLDAVNRILRAAGEYPVSTLAGSDINDTTLAESVLDEVSLKIQLQNVDFNYTQRTLSPDSEGNIFLPVETLACEGAGVDYGRRLTLKGLQLHDLDNDTSVFSSDVVCCVRYKLSFEELETPYQFWIADVAAVEYHNQTVGDPQANQILVGIAAESRRHARAHEIRSRQANVFDGTGAMRQGARRNITGWW